LWGGGGGGGGVVWGGGGWFARRGGEGSSRHKPGGRIQGTGLACGKGKETLGHHLLTFSAQAERGGGKHKYGQSFFFWRGRRLETCRVSKEKMKKRNARSLRPKRPQGHVSSPQKERRQSSRRPKKEEKEEKRTLDQSIEPGEKKRSKRALSGVQKKEATLSFAE